jgi:5-methylcytosine-specific restriction enzyme A
MTDKYVRKIEEVIENIITLNNYKTGDETEREFLRGRTKNGKLFVVLKKNGQYLFSPSKFAGYRGNNKSIHLADLENRDGRNTNKALDKLLGKHLDFQDSRHAKIDAAFLQYCQNLELEPSKHHRPRRYWIVDRKSDATRLDGHSSFQFPDEIPNNAGHHEGSAQSVLVNRWERNPKARRDCVAHHGAICQVCEFDFGEKYGTIGKGYIHVHHLVPLSKIKQKYKVDPINDLCPVCPNCHAMLHRSEPPISIVELRAIVLKNSPKPIG